MSDNDRESELVRYYSSQSLPDEKVDVILASAESENASHGWSRLAIAAGIVFLLLGSAVWYASQIRSKPKPAVPIVEKPGNESEPRFRFVAIRSHNDFCPHCRATGEMFTDLSEQFGDREIEFEQLELQQKDTSEMMRRAKELGLLELVEGKRETAFGVLLSTDGSKPVRFNPSDSSKKNRDRLLEMLDQ